MKLVTFDIYSLRGSDRGNFPSFDTYCDNFSVGNMPTIGLHRNIERDVDKRLKGEVKNK
jgi:hypothetical protein